MNDKEFQENIESILDYLKKGKKINVPSIVPKALPNKKKIEMYVINKKIINQPVTIKLLASWRDKSNIWFPSQFKVTIPGTRKWSVEQLLKKKDRILFFLKLEKNKIPFGHVGLYRFNYKDKSCEIDNIIRGENSKETKGGMTIGLQLLISWTFYYLGIKKLYLRVLSDNKKAISLYSRAGFKAIEKIPLVKVVEDGVISWIEKDSRDKQKKIERYFLKMLLEYNKLI